MTTGGGDTAPRHPRVPAAIALGPILHARHRPEDLDRIAAAVPGSRIVLLGDDGAPDGPLEDAEVLFRGSSLSGDHLDRLLARAPRVVWIHSASVGVERVLTPATLERGITVTNGRGVFSRPIAEYVLMMMLAVRRRLPALLELQRERTWQPLEGGELRDATVGIVGMGSIGRAVASYATVFGAHVIALRRHPELGIQAPADIDEEPLPAPPRAERVFGTSGLPELFAASDFVVSRSEMRTTSTIRAVPSARSTYRPIQYSDSAMRLSTTPLRPAAGAAAGPGSRRRGIPRAG